MRTLIHVAVLFSLAQAQATPDRASLVPRIAESGERTWRKLDQAPPDFSSRELFATALAWCEAGIHLDRLERLFDLAAAMQDRNPANRSFGNFRWQNSHTTIFDYNAVEFSIRGGALVWMRHREKLPASARDKLRELLEFGAEGCLRHRVRESYTNIALMNAGNLVLLGEALDKPAVAKEGYRRLERVLLFTVEGGIHEYGSPTYYGVDLEDLLLIEAFCREDRGREQARALLELFWQDIALNFLPAAQKYAGANSRSYDYLQGLGNLDTHLQLAGWIEAALPQSPDLLYTLLGRWQPPAELRDLKFPRLVRQIWGLEPSQARTHFLCSEISLSTASASYGGRMDFPLTVDLAGPRSGVRCYFTSDGRGDPYGKRRIPESKGLDSHHKALHLNPFWTASQSAADALGLVVYREGDVPAEMPLLQSHFVMPRNATAFFAGSREVHFEPGKPLTLPLTPGEPVVLQQGSTAVGVRVPWANGASAALIDDGNKFGAVRLTVDHRSSGAGRLPAAAFRVRIGFDLRTAADFATWRASFASEQTTATADELGISLQADGMALEAKAPFQEPARIEPAPTRSVLEWDGKDVGLQILSQTAAVRAFLAADTRTVAIRADRGTAWEAEDGRIVPAMEAETDPAASGGRFAWASNDANASGSVRWKLEVARSGNYFLWARVLSPTPEDDSFYVHVTADQKPLLERTEWPVGVHAAWNWVPLNHPQTRKPLAIPLPAGPALLELSVRENGSQVDRLFLTANPGERPPG